MKTRISALMDGELERHEVVETLQALRRSRRICAANGAMAT
jgi:negative regulator of sigma E activity